MAKTAIVGIGNALRNDDAVGLLAARSIRIALKGSSQVEVHECSRQMTDLMNIFERFSDVYLIDAICMVGREVGAVVRLDGLKENIQESRAAASSTHAFDLAQTIGLSRALGRAPTRLVVFGVVADEFGLHEGVSPLLKKSVDKVVHEVLRELAEQGMKRDA